MAEDIYNSMPVDLKIDDCRHDGEVVIVEQPVDSVQIDTSAYSNMINSTNMHEHLNRFLINQPVKSQIRNLDTPNGAFNRQQSLSFVCLPKTAVNF